MILGIVKSESLQDWKFYVGHKYYYFHPHLTTRTTPQVRLKMNDKKPSKFQFYFSGVVEAFSMLKK